LDKIFFGVFCTTLIPQMPFYSKAVLHTIIGNAQKSLLTVSKDMPALLFSALHQC